MLMRKTKNVNLFILTIFLLLLINLVQSIPQPLGFQDLMEENNNIILEKFTLQEKKKCEDRNSTDLYWISTREECEDICKLKNGCIMFEIDFSDNFFPVCYLHSKKCKMVESATSELFELIPFESSKFKCDNGDVKAEKLLQKVLKNHQQLQIMYRMGTGTLQNSPSTCVNRVMQTFCEYNNEWREETLQEKNSENSTKIPHKRSEIQRNCPKKQFPQFNDKANSIISKCNLIESKNFNTKNLVKIGFIILVKPENDAKSIKRLLLSIDDIDNLYVIHVDKHGKSGVQNITEIIPEQMKNRTRIISTQNVLWGGSSLLHAYLDGIKEIREMDKNQTKKCDYILNLSGTDYPMKNIFSFKSFLTKYGVERNISFFDFGNNRENSIPIPEFLVDNSNDKENGNSQNFRDGLVTNLSDEDLEHKVHRLSGVVVECKENRRVLPTLTLRKLPRGIDWREGSFWNVLHRSFIESIFDGKDKILSEKFTEFFSVLSNPDETYFHTLALNSHSCENICSSNLRYENWHPDLDPMHPLFMSESDVRKVIQYDDVFFARKFDFADEDKRVILDLVDSLRK